MTTSAQARLERGFWVKGRCMSLWAPWVQSSRRGAARDGLGRARWPGLGMVVGSSSGAGRGAIGWSAGSVLRSTPMMKGVGEQLTRVFGSGWRAAGRKGINVPEKERGERVWASAAATGISLETANDVSRRGRSAQREGGTGA